MKLKGAPVDTFSPVMNGCGDKLVTTQEPAICGKAKKPKRGKPVASAKDVVEELLASKKQDGLSHRDQLQLQSNLRRVAADFDVPISHIRRDEIDDWLRKRDVANRSRNDLLVTIRVLFSFAKKRA